MSFLSKSDSSEAYETGKMINPLELRRLRSAAINEPSIMMCRNLIKQTLFSRGLTVEKGNIKDNEEDWIRFCEDALDMALTVGFIAYKIIDTVGARIPVVCPIDTFDAYVTEDETTRELIITLYERYDVINSRATAQRVEVPNSHCYKDFGYNPSHSGDINSIVKTVVPEALFMRNITQALSTLEIKRARPTMVTEMTENSNNATDEHEWGFYADVDVAEQSEEAKFKRTEAQIKALADQRELYNTWLHGDDPSTTPSNIFPLPSGHKFVNVPLGNGRQDYTNIKRQVQDVIFGTMGIPRSMIYSDGTHRGDEEATHRTFSATIQYWKTVLSRLAGEAYAIINAKDIVNQVREKRKLENEKSENPSKRVRIGERDILEMKRKTMPKFTFPTAPTLRLDEINMLYDRGALAWKSYLETIALITSLPIDTNLPEPPKPEQMMARGGNDQADAGGVKITEDNKVAKPGDQKNPVKKGETSSQNENLKREKEMRKGKKG